MRGLIRSHFLLASIFFAVVSAHAQEGPVSFEFNFSNPGARSMGLGGAFAALADDATAAFANPAGLVQLIEPEISLEVRRWSYKIPFVKGGRASGEPTGVGIDTERGLRYGTSSNDLTGVSFMSLVYPGSSWALAVYRHQWAEFETQRRINGLFGMVDGELERSEDVLSKTDFKVVNMGLAGSYELLEGLSIGLGLVYFKAKLNTFSEEYGYGEDGFFDPNPFSSDLIDTTYHNNGDDSGYTFHLGLLWQPSPQWSVGGYFRKGPKMTVRITEIVGPANEELPPGTVEVDDASSLQLPDVLGLGAAFRSKDGSLTVSAQWDRVKYSRITEGLNASVFDPGQIKLDDGDEYRLGVEYVFISSKPVIALRLGIWQDPAHGVDSGPEADLFERTIYHGSDDQIHYTGGVGIVFKNLQIDFGVDLADTIDNASLSMVYRF